MQRQRVKESNFLDTKMAPLWFALGTGLVWAFIGFFTADVLSGLLMGILITMAVMFTVIDGLIHIIPNEMILVGLPLAILFQITAFDLKHLGIALICMASIIVVFTVLGLIIGLNKIGAGDVKLAGLMGLALGYPHILYALLIMSVALIVYSLVGMSIGKLTHVSMFAFAPFLMLGLVSGLVLVLFPGAVNVVLA